MRKYYLLLILLCPFLFAGSIQQRQTAVLSQYNAFTAGGASPDKAELFDGDLSAYSGSPDMNDWSIAAGQCVGANATAAMYVTGGVFAQANCQAMEMDIVDGGNKKLRFLLRCDSGGECYGVDVNNMDLGAGNQDIEWDDISTWTSSGSNWESDASADLQDGDWFGVMICEEDASTVVTYWLAPARPDTGGPATWGAATDTFTADPSVAQNTGLYGGVAITGGGATVTIDNLYFWSTATTF